MNVQIEKTRDQWLESLAVGDEVAVDARLNGLKIATVARMTKTLFILSDDRRFNRASGSAKSDSWNSVILRQVTQEIRDRAERAKLELWLSRLKSVPLATLRAMKAAHDAAGSPE